VDSEPLARRAWQEALGQSSYTLTDADMDEILGRPYPVVHAYFAARVDLPDPDAFLTELSAGLFAIFDAELRPFADAARAVAELRSRETPLGVASSSERRRLTRALRLTNMDGCFDVVVAGDEVARGKPEPDIFLAAAQRLGVPPAQCVAVEDSAPGVAAALAAGMGVLGVVRTPGGESALAGAHVVVHEVSAGACARAARAHAR
jgi:HAD superfamily hydrolase (TIGR01509 family)